MMTRLLSVALSLATEARPVAIRCRADRDGHCFAPDCPQLRDGEPEATGRWCPLDVPEEEEL